MKKTTFPSQYQWVILSLIFFLFFPANTKAQVANDIVVFGNTVSESAHKLTSAYSTAYTGQLSQTARNFQPRTDAGSYLLSGNTNGIYGGYCTFKIAVNGTKQNYFTAKMSGDEFDVHQDTDNGRILMSVQGTDGGFYEVGRRAGDGESVFIDQASTSIAPGTFWYRTAAIPRKFTDGKDTISIRLKASGRYYAYGTPWVYSSYQRALLYSTVGVYKAFSHTNPVFTLPATDLKGTSKMTYTKATIASKLADASDLVAAETTVMNNVTNYLNDPDDYIPTYNNNNYNEIEFLAMAYNTSWVTNAYHLQTVVDKIVKLIDNHCVHYNADNTLANAWGGAYGRPAYAMCLVWNIIQPRMLESVNLGLGNKTRSVYWADLFYASFVDGLSDRRTITNQSLEAVMSAYGANMGLQKLGDSRAWSKADALSLMYDALGLSEWRGNYDFSTKKFTYDMGGTGFYMMTAKATTHEPGWVSQDCYGNLGPKILDLFDMTGDSTILKLAVKHEKSQMHFHIPGYYSDVNTKYKQMQTEGIVCWRNVSHPGKVHYVDPYVAYKSNDPELLGVLRQMNSDGQLMNYISGGNEPKSLRIVDAYNTAKNVTSTNTYKDPTTPGQPDFVFADEENGVVSIKRGNEQLFLSFYRRAYDINNYAVAHLITDSTERVIEFKPQIVKYIASGVTNTDDGIVQGASTGIESAGIDAPVTAYKGDVRELPLLSNGATHGNRCIANFYATRIGNYVVAVNSTARSWMKNYAFNLPAGIASAYNNTNGVTETISGPINVAPGQTVVYFLGDSATTNLNQITDATPFEPWPLPGIIQSENYDTGGNGIGYSNNVTSAVNNYRPGDFVDLAPATTPTDGNYWITNSKTGEWFNYTINAVASDNYTCTFRYKTSAVLGKLKISLDGTQIYASSASVMNTYDIWRDLPVTLSVPMGKHSIQVYFNEGGPSLDKMIFGRTYTAVENVNAASKFSIHPNPAQDYLNINGFEEGNSTITLSIYSLQGSQLKQISNAKENSPIYIGDLLKGIYVVKITSGIKSTQNFRLIKE